MNLLLVTCLLVGLILSCQAASACGYEPNQDDQNQGLENLYRMWQTQRVARIPYGHQLTRKSAAGPLRLRFGKRTLGDRIAYMIAEGHGDTESFASGELPKTVV